MRRFFLCAGFVALATPLPTAGATPPPHWTILADCAAAYQANARIADPERSASMTAQISDVAGAYRKAAENAYRSQVSGRAARSRKSVSARIAHQASVYGARSRQEVEALIDTCPQVAG
jgi:hypothetical protein